jgi:hypothetical protein
MKVGTGQVAMWTEPAARGRSTYGMARVERNGDTFIVGDNWKECPSLQFCPSGQKNPQRCDTCRRKLPLHFGSLKKAKQMVARILKEVKAHR